MTVFIEGVRQPSVEVLRNVPATRVLEVRYLDPTASVNLYGPTASGGAVVVRVAPDRSPTSG